MKTIMMLETHSQLRALSDPLRAEMMLQLVMKPFTGQQLSEHFGLPRAKVHYHLKELEKNGLIEIVKTEEKNGIIQKFYRSVAGGFTPSNELLPFAEEVTEASKLLVFQMLENTKQQLLKAPTEAFQHKTATDNPEEWPMLASMTEVTATEEKFRHWLKKYMQLMDELIEEEEEALKDPAGKLYHISSFGFQVADPAFSQSNDKEKETKK